MSKAKQWQETNEKKGEDNSKKLKKPHEEILSESKGKNKETSALTLWCRSLQKIFEKKILALIWNESHLVDTREG